MIIRWIAANTVAWILVCQIVLRFAGFPYIGADSSWQRMMAMCIPVGIACGAIIGSAQWLALRRVLKLPPSWIACTCAYSVLWDLAFRLNNQIGDRTAVGFGMLAGGTLIVALLQVRILGKRVSRPALWLIAAPAACLAGWYAAIAAGGSLVFTSRDAYVFVVGGAAGGFAAGLISAPFLALMLRPLRAGIEDAPAK